MGSKDKIIYHMDMLGLNASQLAEKAGLPKSTVYAILKRDSSNLSYLTALKLSKALECSESEFFTLNEDDKKYYGDLRKKYFSLINPGVNDGYKDAKISNLMCDIGTLLKESSLEYDNSPFTDLYYAFERLNISGQYEAAKRVEELTHIAKYIKPDNQFDQIQDE